MQKVYVDYQPPWIQGWVDVTDSVSNLHLARMATELKNLGEKKPSLSLYNSLLTRRIPKIVLTGGPCSGKSEIMKRVKREMGIDIHCVPEAATIMISHLGINPGTNPYRFNLTNYRIQKIFETTSEAQAIDEGKKAMLLDRGCPDNVAYMERGWNGFEEMCKTTKKFELNQYPLVIYLEVPPKEIYEKSKANNPARTESHIQAIFLGEKIKEMWGEHLNLHIVPNCERWEEKENIVIDIIKKFLA
ncbi:MAG: ATP-binding protein [Candidatus Nealsonbacteria bacterium]